MSDIRAVLTEYGAVLPAPKGDKWLPMKCPFHGDDQASASVNEVADRFNCHGCMTHSEDAVGLIQWWEECGYRAAVERLEGITGSSHGAVRRRDTRPSGLAGLLS